MSETTKKLREILSKSNEQFTSNWVHLAQLIMHYENKDWKQARSDASELFKEGNALDYVQVVRDELKPKKSKKTTSKKRPAKRTKDKVAPLNTKRDRFSMNYKHLVELIPDLIERLESGEMVYGKSQLTGYMDFNIELLDKDATGYYVAISHYYTQNGDMIADPDMQILVNVKNQTVEALEFQNSMYFRKVYDNTSDRKLVNTKEKRSQNAFLNQWLKNLISQGHKVNWKHLDDKNPKPKDQKKKEEEITPKDSKPDISYMDESVIANIRDSIDKMKMEKIAADYISYVKGTLLLAPIDIYFMIDRLNNEQVGFKVPYPNDEFLKEHYDMIVNKKAASSKTEDSTKTKDSESIFESNFKKLLKIAPGLSIKMNGIRLSPKKGKVFRSKSSKKDLLYDLHAKLSYGEDYEATLLLIEKKGKDGETHTAMRLHVNNESKEVFALSTESDDGKPIYVYSNEKKFEGANKKELKEQNDFLSNWLDELVRKGHLMKGWKKQKMESEVVDEYDKESPEPKKVDKSEQEKTAKHWTKLAAFIEKTEGLNKEESKKKAIELKQEGKAENYVSQNFNRQVKVNKNGLLKTNYQKLLRLFSGLNTLKNKSKNRYAAGSGEPYIDVAPIEKQGQFGKQYDIFEHGDKHTNWLITVQKVAKKVTVNSHVIGKQESKSDELDKSFGKWLDQRISKDYVIGEKLIGKLLKSYPIVVEWAENSDDQNLGLNSLEELHERMKTYGVPKEKDTYNKVKVWFRGIPTYIRIDLSKTKTFDPTNKDYDLEDWLENVYPKYDWFKYSSETDKKKLQKKADKVPKMEVGKVKLTKEHRRAGLTQKHVNWINRHKQGIVITPTKKMTNNTKSFARDEHYQAKRAGKRISKTGRIYYETRSNRSDMTDAGL